MSSVRFPLRSRLRHPVRHRLRPPVALVRTDVRRRVGTVAVLAVVNLFATATAALAHPGFRPDDVPAGRPVEVELVIEHACAEDGGEPAEGEEASPTVLVAMMNTETFTILPRPVPGWSIVTEDDEVRWDATDGGETGELVLPAVVEVVGDSGDEVPQPLYQECANGEFYRWSAAPGEDGDPQINLAIAEGTPPPLATPAPTATSMPAPSTPAPPTAAPTSLPTPTATTDAISTPATPTPSVALTPSTAPTTAAGPSVEPTSTPSVLAADDGDDEGDDDGGFSPAIWVAVFVAAFAGVAGIGLATRDRGDGPDDDEVTS